MKPTSKRTTLLSAIAAFGFTLSPIADAQDARNTADLYASASEYASVIEDAARYKTTTFSAIDDIDAAMDRVAGLDPEAASQSWVAYAAAVALDTPAFVDSVKAATDFYGVDAIADGLRLNTSYAGQLDGASEAKAAAFARISRDGLDGRVAAAQIKAQAYDLQAQSWAITARTDKAERLNAVTNAPLRPTIPSPSTVEALLNRSLTATSEAGLTLVSNETAGSGRSLLGFGLRGLKISRGDRGAAPAMATRSVYRGETIGQKIVREQNEQEAAPIGLAPTERMNIALDRALTLAALTVINQNTPQDVADLAPQSMTRCLQTAKLHLQQCVAVSRFAYEDPFCIAEHGLDDVAMCYTEASYSR